MNRTPTACIFALAMALAWHSDATWAQQTPSDAPPIAPEVVNPCPDGFECVEDGVLIALITRLDRELSLMDERGTENILSLLREMEATRDPRLLPLYQRLLAGSNKAITLATLKSLGSLAKHPEVERIAAETAQKTESSVLLNAALTLLFKCELVRQTQTLPCPPSGACAPDAEVLNALLSLQGGDENNRLEAIDGLGQLQDDRLLPFLLRVSFSAKSTFRTRALAALSQYENRPQVTERLSQAFGSKNLDDRKAGLAGLVKDTAPATTDFLLTHRLENPKDALKAELEAELQRRVPEKLKAIVEEERRLEEERQRKLAEEAARKANEPNLFDRNTRGLLTGANALSAALAGAAVANLTADTASSGDDDLGGLATCWGCGVGATAAGTLSWFSLADRELKSEDLNLALSTSAWTGYSSFQLLNFIASAQNSSSGFDSRHYMYGVPTGVLLGSWLGTLASLNTDLDHGDVGEIHAAVILNNLLLGGIALTVPNDQQGVWYPWSQIAGTVAGYALALPLHDRLELDAKGWGQAALGGLAGLIAGGLYGSSLSDGAGANPRYVSTNTGAGYAMVSTALGAATGVAYRLWGEENLSHLYAQTSLGLWGAAIGHHLPEVFMGEAPDYSRSRFFSTAAGYTALSALAYALPERNAFNGSGTTRLNMETLAGYWLATGLANSVPDLDLGLRVDHLAATAGLATGVSIGFLKRNNQPLSKAEKVNAALTPATGLLAGLQLGAGLNGLDDANYDVGAYALLGGGLGLVAADLQGRAGSTPTGDGLVYQGWASAAGNMLGSGLGLLLAAPVTPNAKPVTGEVVETTDNSPLPGLLGSAGLILGASSGAFFPDGVEQDRGDLILNPMLMGLSAWHALAIGSGFGLSTEASSGLLLSLPAVTSVATVALAPKLDLSFGDILMITGSAAWGNLMGIGIASSIGHHAGDLTDLQSGLLATGLLDLGMGIGFALTAIDHPHLGWKFTYVASTTAIGLLLASLPAALFTADGNGPVALSDLLLGASLVGTGVGLATLHTIDFRVAPTVGLSKKPSEDDGEKDMILKPMDPEAKLPFDSFQPTVVAIPPVPGLEDKPQMGAGFVGTF